MNVVTAPAEVPRLRQPEYLGLTLGMVAVVVSFAFEAMAVATAMPVAAAELGGLRSYGLAFSVFLTASLVGMVLAGEIGDRRGPVPPLVGSTVLFVAGLAAAGAAPTMTLFVLSRGIQGLGAGLGVVALYLAVARAYPEQLRARVFSAISAGWVLPAIVGPPVAGFLADEASWRWAFFAVIPLSVMGTLLVLPRLQGAAGRPEATAGDRAARRRTGIRRVLAAFAAAVTAGVLQQLGQDPTWARLPVAVVALAVLVASVRVLLPAGSLRLARGLPTVVVLRGVFAGAFFAAETFIPLTMVQERGLSTAVAGGLLTVGALTWTLGSWYQGRAALPFSRAVLVTAGLVLVSAGILAMAVVVLLPVPTLVAAGGWALAALGMGLGITSLSVLLLELSPAAEQGANAAALQASDALGSVLLIGAAATVFAALHRPGQPDTGAFLVIYGFAAAVALAGALGVAGRVRPAR